MDFPTAINLRRYNGPVSSPSSNTGLPTKGGFASTRVRYQTGSVGQNLCATDLKRHWNTPSRWCLIIKLQFENLSNSCKQRTVNRVVFVKFEPRDGTKSDSLGNDYKWKWNFWVTFPFTVTFRAFIVPWGQNPFYSRAQAKIELEFCFI